MAAARTVEIIITGEAGQYTAEIQKIIEKNNLMNRDATRGAQQTASALGEVQRILINFPSFLGGIATGMATAFGVGAITAFVRSALTGLSALQDLSEQTGLTAQNLAVLRLAGIATGQGVDEAAAGVVRLQRTLIESRAGTEPMNKGLQQLRLSSQEFNTALADPNQLVEIFARRLSEIPNQAERNAVAMELAGRSGSRLAATLLDLAANEEKYRQSIGFTNDQVRTLDAGIDQLAQTWQKLKDSVALAVVELAKWIGLIERTKVEDLNKQLQENGRQLQLQVQHLNQLREAQEKGALEPQHQKAQQKELQETTARVFGLLDAQEQLNKQLRAEDTQPPPKPPSPPVDTQQALKNAQAIAELKKQIDQTNLSTLQAAEGTERYSQAQHDAALAALDAEQAEKIAAATKDKTIAATRVYIDQLYEAKRALFEANEKNKDTARYIEDANRALETEAEDAKIAAEAGDLHAKSVNNVIQRLLEQIDIEHQLGDLEADKLAAVGRTAEAEKLRAENQIKNLQALKAYEVANAKDEQARLDAIRLRDSQIDLAQTQLQQLGVASVNVGHAIADTLNDIFTAVIQGTLKAGDIGKSLLAGVARTAGDFFTQILNKKLGFENIIIDNMHGLPGQIFQAFGLGAAALPGGQAGGGGSGGLVGNLLSTILGSFGGGGSMPGIFSSFPGASGNLGDLSQFTFGSSGVGGSSGGGILGSLAGLLGTSGQGSGLGGIGRIFSDIFGGNSALGSFGGPLLGGVGSLLLSLFKPGAFGKGQLGGTLGQAGGAAIGAIFGPIGAILGGILGQLLGGLFNQIPNPTVWVKSILKFYYDALTDSFGFFNTSTITKIKDISGGKAAEVLAQHQEILKGLGDKFVDLLNVFPSQFHDIIAAQLDDANRVLNDIFGFKKYTEGGSRNIQKELDDLKNKEGPLGFFVALRGALGTGLAATLRQSGFNFDDIISQQFPFPPNPTPRDFPFRGGVPGLLPPEGADNFDKFIDALNKFVSFTGTLSAISPRGIAPFVTGLDQERLQAEIQKVLETPGEGFADAVDKMLQRVQPLTDFLKQSVSEATDLFGRGLMAALEAATASEANQAFLQNIGEGVKDKIFSGITEAFIASAQFTDLLAPIQQIIRQFTQDALASGQTPDIGAFRAALLPAIEDISTRAESLRPLIEALQALGFDVTHALESLIGSGTVGGGNNVTINIENFNREDDPQVLAQRIQDLLNGRTAP